jgi:hypothetical protein
MICAWFEENVIPGPLQLAELSAVHGMKVVAEEKFATSRVCWVSLHLWNIAFWDY